MPLPGFGSAITASELRKKRLAAQRPTNYGPYSSPSAYANPSSPAPSPSPYRVTTVPLSGPTTTTTTQPLSTMPSTAGIARPEIAERLDPKTRRKRRLTKVPVPEIVPKQYRKAVARHGQRLNEPLQEAGIDMSGPEYLAKLVQFESGWDPEAYNPSSASGLGQFIDSTAQDFRERLGVETQDPSRPRQMLKGASMHASGDFGYNPLYAGYNPGYSDTDPIPSVESGRNVNVRVPSKAVKRLSSGVDAPASGATGASQPKRPPMRRLQRLLPGGEPDDYRQTDPRLLRRTMKVARESGDPIDINSGYRSEDEQQALYDSYLAGTGNLAAPPGSSKHETGNALDLDLTDEQRGLLGDYGLGLPVPGEDWHVELTDDSGYAASGGMPSLGGGVPAVSSGVPSATSPAPPRRSLRELVGGGGASAGPRAVSGLAARAPLPNTRLRGEEDEEEEQEEETLSELLRRLGIANAA